jgi:nucleoside-diphosphate-sugar epimerase
LEHLIGSRKPDLWFQHAGWAKDYGSPEYDLAQGHRINVLPLDTMYPQLKSNGCQGIVITGSSAEYSNGNTACREGDACFPSTPYGLSKLSQTIRAGQLAEQYGLPTRIARVFIPYGQYDNPKKLIPSVSQALMTGQPVDLSPCMQQRDFIAVDDLIQGYLALAEDLKRADLFDIFNLCSGEAITLKMFLENIACQLRADPALLNFGSRPMRPGEPPVSFGDAEKAGKLLCWKASPLQIGITRYLQAEVSSHKPVGAA